MVLTSDKLAERIHQADKALESLRASAGLASSSIEDVCSLIAIRRDLVALREFRRTLNGGKIVELELWRSGRPASSCPAERRPSLWQLLTRRHEPLPPARHPAG